MEDAGNAGTIAQWFAPIQPPRIKSISQKALQEFLVAREAYEDAVSTQTSVTAVPLRSCFTGVFLKSLTRARLFGVNVKTVQQCTDAVIQAKLKEVAGRTRNVFVQSALADVRRNVRIDVSEPDARLKIVMLFASYLELCEKRGWSFVVTAKKAAISHIIAVLQPLRLKAGMEDAIELEQIDLQADYFAFTKFLAEKAEILEEVTPLREYLNSIRPGRDPPEQNRLLSSSQTPMDTRRADPPKTCDRTSESDPPKKTLPPCLRPKCSKKHPVKDCLKTNRKHATELLDEYREKKKERKPSQVCRL